MIRSQRSVTWKIGRYLNRLLRPFVGRIAQSRTFRDEPDFIQRLNSYAQTPRRLHPTTLFCTLRVANRHALASHKSMVETVGYFLQDNLATNRLGPTTIATIQNPLQLFLYNNIFCYKHRI